MPALQTRPAVSQTWPTQAVVPQVVQVGVGVAGAVKATEVSPKVPAASPARITAEPAQLASPVALQVVRTTVEGRLASCMPLYPEANAPRVVERETVPVAVPVTVTETAWTPSAVTEAGVAVTTSWPAGGVSPVGELEPHPASRTMAATKASLWIRRTMDTSKYAPGGGA